MWWSRFWWQRFKEGWKSGCDLFFCITWFVLSSLGGRRRGRQFVVFVGFQLFLFVGIRKGGFVFLVCVIGLVKMVLCVSCGQFCSVGFVGVGEGGGMGVREFRGDVFIKLVNYLGVFLRSLGLFRVNYVVFKKRIGGRQKFIDIVVYFCRFIDFWVQLMFFEDSFFQ